MKKNLKNVEMAYDMIQDGMVVSLGGGSNVEALCKMLHEKPKDISLTTPSPQMKKLFREYGFKVIDSRFLDHVDLAFDGCNEIDEDLNALKSAGGIHTREKILAEMADQYIILTDSTKAKKKLQFRNPICLEVVKPALSSVIKKLRDHSLEVTVRENAGNGNLYLTEDGNYLLNVKLKSIKDLKKLDADLNSMVGVLEHSLFYHLIDQAIVAYDDGRVEVLKPKYKNEQQKQTANEEVQAG